MVNPHPNVPVSWDKHVRTIYIYFWSHIWVTINQEWNLKRVVFVQIQRALSFLKILELTKLTLEYISASSRVFNNTALKGTSENVVIH